MHFTLSREHPYKLNSQTYSSTIIPKRAQPRQMLSKLGAHASEACGQLVLANLTSRRVPKASEVTSGFVVFFGLAERHSALDGLQSAKQLFWILFKHSQDIVVCGWPVHFFQPLQEAFDRRIRLFTGPWQKLA